MSKIFERLEPVLRIFFDEKDLDPPTQMKKLYHAEPEYVFYDLSLNEFRISRRKTGGKNLKGAKRIGEL